MSGITATGDRQTCNGESRESTARAHGARTVPSPGVSRGFQTPAAIHC
jgi:hypothetical protein